MLDQCELFNVIIVLLIGINIVLSYLLIRELYFRVRLNRLRAITQAIILEKRVMHGRGTNYYVSYEFTHNAQTYTKKSLLVGKAVYMSLPEGSTVPIQYLPFAPHVSKLWGEYDDGEYLLLLLMSTAVSSFFTIVFGGYFLTHP
jgi:hypothetical protein